MLTDGTPVDVRLAKLAQVVPQDVVLRIALFGVGVDDFLRRHSGVSENLAIASEVGYLEVERHARLLSAFEVARASQFEVLLGDLETVGAIDHYLNAFAGGLRYFIVGDEHTVALVSSSAHSTT